MADVSVELRGLKDISGRTAFNTAYSLAMSQSYQWLKVLDKAMAVNGGTDYWNRVKNTTVSQLDREKQYEDYGRMGFQMISAGNYPPSPTQAHDREIYLRLQLHTADVTLAGTNADIELRADGRKFLLDYAPRVNFITAYNDFERNDDTSYVVGPFSDFPRQIELYNNSPKAKTIINNLYLDFKETLQGAYYKTGDMVLSLVAGHADKVAQAQKVWESDELNNLTSQNFVLDLDGKTEGRYQVDGTLRRVSQTETENTFEVQLHRSRCLKESTWDRGSNSDEPFTLFAIVPLPGTVQAYKAGPFKDTDTGEHDDINKTFLVTLPRGYGMLTISAQQWESDDETEATRNKMLQSFAGKLDAETAVERQSFLGSIGSSIAADWKLADIEVYAWENTSPTVVDNLSTPRTGFMLQERPNRWIEGGSGATFNLDRSRLRGVGMSVQELLGGTPGTILIPERLPRLDTPSRSPLGKPIPESVPAPVVERQPETQPVPISPPAGTGTPKPVPIPRLPRIPRVPVPR